MVTMICTQSKYLLWYEKLNKGMILLVIFNLFLVAVKRTQLSRFIPFLIQYHNIADCRLRSLWTFNFLYFHISLPATTLNSTLTSILIKFQVLLIVHRNYGSIFGFSKAVVSVEVLTDSPGKSGRSTVGASSVDEG